MATLAAVFSLTAASAAGAARDLPGSPLAPCSVAISTDAGAITADGKGKPFLGDGTLSSCHAELPEGTDVQTEVITGEACKIVVTAGGRVNSICR